MMTKQQVRHIAKLARLGLTENELQKYRKELSLILDYFVKLEEVKTAGIEADAHTRLLKNVFRKDEIKKAMPEKVNKLIEAAPEKKGRYLKVKTVL